MSRHGRLDTARKGIRYGPSTTRSSLLAPFPSLTAPKHCQTDRKTMHLAESLPFRLEAFAGLRYPHITYFRQIELEVCSASACMKSRLFRDEFFAGMELIAVASDKRNHNQGGATVGRMWGYTIRRSSGIGLLNLALVFVGSIYAVFFDGITGWRGNGPVRIAQCEIRNPKSEIQNRRHPVKVVTPFGLRWVRTGGPLGGLGYDVRMRPDNPDILYVTDAWSGVNVSVDGGRTWRPSNNGIITRAGDSGDAVPVFCLTIDPHPFFCHRIQWPLSISE